MTNLYTAEEISRHNNEKDLWVVIHGGVYDLTKFLKEHPGGEEVILDVAGGDGTKCFDDIGHSQEALKLRDNLKVGELIGTIEESNATSGVTATVDDDDWEYQEPKQETSPWLPVTIAAGVAAYAFIFYYLWY